MEGIMSYNVVIYKPEKRIITIKQLGEYLTKLYGVTFKDNQNVSNKQLNVFAIYLLKTGYSLSGSAKNEINFTLAKKTDEDKDKLDTIIVSNKEDLKKIDDKITISFATYNKLLYELDSRLSLRGLIKRLSIEYKEVILQDYLLSLRDPNSTKRIFTNPSYKKRWLSMDAPNDFYYTDIFADSLIPENVRQVLKLSKTEFNAYKRSKLNSYSNEENKKYNDELSNEIKEILNDSHKYKSEEVWEKAIIYKHFKLLLERMRKSYENEIDHYFEDNKHNSINYKDLIIKVNNIELDIKFLEN
jgi:hypothetical protein